MAVKESRVKLESIQCLMTTKEQLLQELEQASEDLIEATLGFLRSAKADRQNTSTSEASSDNPLLSLLAKFDEFAANMPADEVARLPIDGAQQHDHYLYGTAKRKS